MAVGAWKIGDYTDIRPVIKQEFKEYSEIQAEAASDNLELLKGLIEQQSMSQSQLSTSLMELQFQTLTLKRKSGALDWYEEQNRCRIAKKLDYINVDGCNQ